MIIEHYESKSDDQSTLKYRKKVFDIKNSKIYVEYPRKSSTCFSFDFREFIKPSVREDLEVFIAENYASKFYTVSLIKFIFCANALHIPFKDNPCYQQSLDGVYCALKELIDDQEKSVMAIHESENECNLSKFVSYIESEIPKVFEYFLF